MVFSELNVFRIEKTDASQLSRFGFSIVFVLLWTFRTECLATDDQALMLLELLSAASQTMHTRLEVSHFLF